MTALQLPTLLLVLAVTLATATANPNPTSFPPVAASGPAAELGGAALQQLVTQAAHANALAKAAAAPVTATSPDLRHKDLNELLTYVKSQMSPASAPTSQIFNQLTASASDVATPPAAAATSTPQKSGTTTAVAPTAAALFAVAFAGYFVS